MWARGTPRALGARGPVARPRTQGQTSLTPGLAGIRRPSTPAALRARTGPARHRPAGLWITWWTTGCGPT
eukprot:6743633-Alexandrium_andersonii.AAC.1